MRFNLPLLTTALALVGSAPLASAADCYKNGGCKQCESKDQMWKAREELCNTDKWKKSNVFTWGWAVVNLSGRFHDQQSCWDGFENIINQCYGKKDGGLYDWNYDGDSAHLDVDFCNCR